MIKNNFLIDENTYVKPQYTISPFSSVDIGNNKIISDKNSKYISIRKYLERDKQYIYTENGRNAIYKSLIALKLESDDIVTIFTTTNNFYISSCVTKEIEKICKWSRELSDKTKAILVNHEFGWCYKELNRLRELNIPIIEDCAHSFVSNTPDKLKGEVGDFVIYSLPKYFPIQIGGILYYKEKYSDFIRETLEQEKKKHIESVLEEFINNISSWNFKRLDNYNYIKIRLETLGLFERLKLDNYTIPSVYLFNSKGKIDYDKLKLFLYNNGVECSKFYGEEAFFIPIHHNLNHLDLDYFFEIISFFLEEINENK